MGLSKSKIAQLFLEFSCFVAFVQTLFSKILLYYFAGLLDSNWTGVEPFTSSFKEGFGSQILQHISGLWDPDHMNLTISRQTLILLL